MQRGALVKGGADLLTLHLLLLLDLLHKQHGLLQTMVHPLSRSDQVGNGVRARLEDAAEGLNGALINTGLLMPQRWQPLKKAYFATKVKDALPLHLLASSLRSSDVVLQKEPVTFKFLGLISLVLLGLLRS